MDNYGMRKNARKWEGKEEEIELVESLDQDGFTFSAIVLIVKDDFEISEDEAEILVSEILQID